MERSTLEQAFRQAVYSLATPAGPRQFRIGEHVAGLHGATFAMLTAYNPGGIERGASENRAAQQQLRHELSARRFLMTDGFSHDGDGRHREPQFGVFGISREEALWLAARFGQAAIVWFGGETAELAWVEAPPAKPT